MVLWSGEGSGVAVLQISRCQKFCSIQGPRMIERRCPVCGRQILVENGFFTQHTDGREHGKRFPQRPLPSCPAVGTPYKSPAMSPVEADPYVWRDPFA